jgi:hypothetical protein
MVRFTKPNLATNFYQNGGKLKIHSLWIFKIVSDISEIDNAVNC